MPPKYRDTGGHDAPNWRSRAVIVLAAGRWKMRNGQIAIVTEELKLPYINGATKKMANFICWKGACECCNAPMTWNTNGTFAAAGSHPFDIIGKEK
jgi:hypothetical protein